MAVGCKSAQKYHKDADRVAYEVIDEKQRELGMNEPVLIETAEQKLRRRLMLDQDLARSSDASLSSEDVAVPKNWPEKVPDRPTTAPSTLDESRHAPFAMTLVDALKIAAKSSREYQARKEQIFLSALSLDLERNDFRTTFSGTTSGTVISDQNSDQTGVVGAARITPRRRLRNGALLVGNIGVDVVNLLTGSHDSSRGLTWDASVTMPLLRGGGEAIVLEPLTQAERNVAYELLDFQQYKRQFAVTVASQYLNVLSQYDQIRNAEDAYRRAIDSTLRARRQADAGRMRETEVDQSLQQELSSRERWISAQANLGRRLDVFKVLLGLPPDVAIELDPSELKKMSDIQSRVVAGPAQAIADAPGSGALSDARPGETPATNPVTASTIDLPPSALSNDGTVPTGDVDAIATALQNRPDLRVSIGRVFDAQRKAIVAANALQAGLTLTGSARSGSSRSGLGSASSPDATAHFDEGVYQGGLLLDLPLERTAERNAYRSSLISVQSAIRAFQRTEDDVKQSVRNDIRDLLLGRERIIIQAKSVALAEKRVASTSLFMEAGRVQVRDVLEAQDSLVRAQNALTTSLVDYRIAELSLQRDTGILEIDHEGMWKEYEPLLARRRSINP